MRAKSFMLGLLILTASSVHAAYIPVTKSTSRHQTSVEVTVYSNNLALIKEVRKLKLPAGEGRLKFLDIASQLKPQTVQISSLTHGKDFSVMEQNYRYDLITADNLLDRYVGKSIKIIDFNKYKDRKEIIDAILISNNNGQVYKINDEIYLDHPGYKILPQLPDNFVARPTLSWLYHNKTEGDQELELFYLTSDINWTADYTVILNNDNSSLDISAWASVNNTSGTSYENASLKLIAGQVGEAERPQRADVMIQARRSMPAAESRRSVTEAGLFEYHTYELSESTTINDKQTKQISLFTARGISTAQEYVMEGTSRYFIGLSAQKNHRQPIFTYAKFKNSVKNHLGTPLAAGTMRFYKRDSGGHLQFIGESRIGHTPVNEDVEIKVGEAFDIVAERSQTSYKRVASNLHESEWEIVLRNHKDKTVTINVQETIMGNWEILSHTHPYQKLDANRIQFNVKLPVEQEIKLIYRVKVGL